MRWLLAIVLMAALVSPADSRPAPGELLYNGITLPTPWPPAYLPPTQPPKTPYYLTTPPALIPIDVGRQLFVDDFLVEQTTLTRTYHRATIHPASPVLKPEKDWEKKNGAMAIPFSDGVWYDPKDQLYKMWYMGGYLTSTCYATSKDGLVWERPSLSVVPGTNIVHNGTRDSTSVLLNHAVGDPARRFTLFRSTSGMATVQGAYGLGTHDSADGLAWTEPPRKTGSNGDRSTVFYNPFRKVWVYSLRHGWGKPRQRRYWETPDLLTGPMWTNITDPPMWIGADTLDLPRPDLNVAPELYNLDCIAYESVMLGMFTIWYGVPATSRPKINEVQVGYSRDGWSWVRPDRRAFVGVSEDPAAWNYGNVQSTTGGLLVMGDELWFYVSGRKGDGTKVDAGGSTGLATLRRDGFASMDAGASGGALTTRLLKFSGKHLFVNVNNPSGELTAEVLDESGRVISPFSKANSVAAAANSTRRELTWTGAADLSSLAGRAVKFRFHLKNGSLYSFWVSPDRTGASRGYVGAGGPGFTGATDTVGGPVGNAPPPPPAPAASGSGPSSTPCGCGAVRSGSPSLLLTAAALSVALRLASGWRSAA